MSELCFSASNDILHELIGKSFQSLHEMNNECFATLRWITILMEACIAFAMNELNEDVIHSLFTLIIFCCKCVVHFMLLLFHYPKPKRSITTTIRTLSENESQMLRRISNKRMVSNSWRSHWRVIFYILSRLQHLTRTKREAGNLCFVFSSMMLATIKFSPPKKVPQEQI